MAEQEKMKKLFRLIIICSSAVFWGLFIMFLSSDRDYSFNQKKHARMIGVSYMTTNNEYYRIIHEEIASRVEAEGDRLILRNPALNANRQIDQIEEMMEEGMDLLVITPVDDRKLTPVLKKVKQKGIPVVVLDTDISDDSLVDCMIKTDNYMAGNLIGKYFTEITKESRILIMTHDNAKSGRDRVKGFMDEINRHEGYTVVAMIECQGQLEIAMPRLQEAMKGNLDFTDVFCLNDPAAIGVVAALEEQNRLDQVNVYGVDASPDAKVLIHEGMMKATAAQFPTRIGKRAGDVIYRIMNNQPVKKEYLIMPDLVNESNVDDFGLFRWQ